MRAAGGRVLSQRGVVAAAVASLLLAAAAAGGSAVSSAQPARGASPRIGGIKKLFLGDLECNCTLYLPARRNADGDEVVPTVFAEADLRGQAQVNIDGQDVMLRRVERRARAGRGGPLRVGQRSVEEYEGEGVRVRVVSTITEVCPRDEPTCETLSKSAVITVTKGGRTATARATGGCACN
jgi:hypothetical protein